MHGNVHAIVMRDDAKFLRPAPCPLPPALSECTPPVTLLRTASSESRLEDLMKRMLLLSLMVLFALPLAAQQQPAASVPAASAPAPAPSATERAVAIINGE